mgnify:CR=1 FL=1
MNKKFKNDKEMWQFISKVLKEKKYVYIYRENEKEIEVYNLYEDKGLDNIYDNDIIIGKILYNDISKTAIIKLFSYPDEKYVLRVEPAYPEAMEDIFNTSFTKYLDELTEIFTEKSLEIKQKILVDILEIKKTYEKDEEEFYEETF